MSGQICFYFREEMYFVLMRRLYHIFPERRDLLHDPGDQAGAEEGPGPEERDARVPQIQGRGIQKLIKEIQKYRMHQINAETQIPVRRHPGYADAAAGGGEKQAGRQQDDKRRIIGYGEKLQKTHIGNQEYSCQYRRGGGKTRSYFYIFQQIISGNEVQQIDA